LQVNASAQPPFAHSYISTGNAFKADQDIEMRFRVVRRGDVARRRLGVDQATPRDGAPYLIVEDHWELYGISQRANRALHTRMRLQSVASQRIGATVICAFLHCFHCF
jgi:hypothetical protein